MRDATEGPANLARDNTEHATPRDKQLKWVRRVSRSDGDSCRCVQVTSGSPRKFPKETDKSKDIRALFNEPGEVRLGRRRGAAVPNVVSSPTSLGAEGNHRCRLQLQHVKATASCEWRGCGLDGLLRRTGQFGPSAINHNSRPIGSLP